GVAAVFAAPHGGRAAGAGASRRRERQDVDRVGVVRMGDDGETEVGRKALRGGAPGVAMIVAAENADVGTASARTVPFGPAAVVLHVKPARRVFVAGNLVDALAELGIRIGREPSPDTLVRRI